MYVLSRWMDVLNRWMDGSTDGWMEVRMDGQKHEWIDYVFNRWMDGCIF